MQVYIEETVAPEGRLQRRSANSDKWINSGGIKGSTTIWLTDVGVRKRYGKYTSARSGWSAKFEAYTLLTGSRAQPVENSTPVAFVSNTNPVVAAEHYRFSFLNLCFLPWFMDRSLLETRRQLPAANKEPRHHLAVQL